MVFELPWYLLIPLGLVGGVFLAVWVYHFYLQIQFPGECKVVWSYIPLLGSSLEFGQRPVEFLRELAAKCDEIVGVIVMGQRVFFVFDIFSAPVVFKSNNDYGHGEIQTHVLVHYFGFSEETFRKGGGWDDDMMRKWYGQYLLGDKPLQAITERMERELNRDVKNIPLGRVYLYDCIAKLIFKASLAGVLNENAAGDESLFQIFTEFDNGLPLVLAGLPTMFLPALPKLREQLLAAVEKYKDNNCELFEKRWTYFNQLVQDNKLEAREAAVGQLAILWASVSNTMPGTFWTVFFMLRNPIYLEKLVKEVKAVWPAFQQPDTDLSLPYEALNQLVFLDACITETMRLVSGSLIMRHVNHACSVTFPSGKTYKFRKGDRLGICPPVLHSDEEVFKNASAFDPDRWMLPDLDPGAEYSPVEKSNAAQGKMRLFKQGKEIPSANSFLAFGAGVTYCPGRKFARNELKILLVYILHRLDIQLAEDCPTPPVKASRAGIGIFPPGEDIAATVTLRAS